MKKLIAGVILLGMLSSCGNKKAKIDPFASITKEVDSIRYKTDSIHQEELPEEPQPIQADESFDDFIYNFASDDVLQRQRVKFPLPYYNGDKKLDIDEHHWKHDDLFTKQHYYTLLFDREEDMDLVGDTALTSVQVEWIFVKTRMMKKYYFERIKGAWMLEAINLRPIEQDDNEDFVEFFGRFAVDSLFQSRRIREPLIFVTSDPDDDFSILETTLDRDQWFAFKPELPSERLSNINYGQRNDDNSTTKILALKGIGNGFPMAGVLISPMFKPVYGQLGTTFGGNHLACSAALAVMDVIEQENLIENAKVVGNYLLEELKKFPQIKEVRGRGLMIGLEFEKPIKELRSRLIYDEHVFTGASGTNVLRLLPPLCLTMEEAEDFLARFKKVL